MDMEALASTGSRPGVRAAGKRLTQPSRGRLKAEHVVWADQLLNRQPLWCNTPSKENPSCLI